MPKPAGSCRTSLLLGAIALAGPAVLPAAAGAHAIVTVDGPTISYSSRDATDRNTLTVSIDGDRVRMLDTTVVGGIAPGPCDPGRVDSSGYIIEVLCPRTSSSRLRLDVGDREDSVDVRAALPATIFGGPGADVLTGGDGPDQIDGGEGEDRLAGGGGDDVLLARDGAADAVSCGAGTDRAELDAVDGDDGACEALDRTPGVPGAPGGGGGTPGGTGAGTRTDTTPPRVQGGALTRQRIGRSRTLRILATSSEPATLGAGGTVQISGQRINLGSVSRRVTVAGGGTELRLRLSVTTWRQVRGALARRRRIRAVIVVVATDRAGNSSATRLPAITLAR